MFLENTKNEVATSIASGLLFAVLGFILRKFRCIDKNVSPDKEALWFNTLTSMIHSMILTFLCTICFSIEPYLWLQLASTKSNIFAQTSASISIGYFIYDFYDIVKGLKFANQWPVLIHHIIVVTEFVVAGWVYGLYNYLLVALSCEVNTIFLHLRQLFRLSKVQQNRIIYRLNKHINLFTYLVFRMATLFWMLYSVVRDRNKFPSVEFWFFGFMGISLMGVINIILLYRLVKSDYMTKHKLE